MIIKHHFQVRSLIVKTLIVNGKTVYRHFFEWFDRAGLELCYLRLLLIRQDGYAIGKLHNIKFPKVKLLGTITVEKLGEETARDHYDKTPYFYIDADEIAAGFEYYTGTLAKKSTPTIDAISPKREDLTDIAKKDSFFS